MPYVFTARHHNYACYDTYYVRSSYEMSNEICRLFLHEERLAILPELGTGCGDMVSDDRKHFVRYGIGPRDLIGTIVKHNAMTSWALSLHMCCRLQKNIREMTLIPARDVDEEPSQRQNDAAHVQMTMAKSGTSLKS